MGGPNLAAVFSGLAIVFMLLAVASTVMPLVAMAYVALRIQDARQETPDPRLGMKTAFHLIHTLSILLVLIGASIFTVDQMSGAIAPNKVNLGPAPPNPFGAPAPRVVPGAKGEASAAAQRVAAGLITSGLLFGISFWAFLFGTNDNTHRSVRRVFVGARMALCLLVTMITVTGLMVVMMQKTPEHELTESLIGMFLVWFPAACLQMVFFFRLMGDSTVSSRRSSRPKREKEKDADSDVWVDE